MIHSHYKQFELLTELAQRLAFLENNEAPSDNYVDIDKECDAWLLAALTAAADLNGPKLDRGYVADLLAGLQSYTNGAGEQVFFATKFTVEQLLEVSLLRFIGDILEIPNQYGIANAAASTNSPQLAVVNELSNIRYGRGDFPKPRLQVALSVAQSILGEHKTSYTKTPSLSNLEYLTSNHTGGFDIELPTKMVHLVAGKLWFILVGDDTDFEKQAKLAVFKRWFFLMTYATESNDICRFDFVDEKSKFSFLSAAAEYVLQESDLLNSWQAEARKLTVERHRANIFYDDYAIGAREITIKLLDHYCCQPLNANVASLFEAYMWCVELAADVPFSQLGIVGGLTHLIVKSERDICNPADNRPLLQTLIKGCIDRPDLSSSLLYQPFNQGAPIPYLISRADTAEIGLLQLLSNEQRIYSDHSRCEQDNQLRWELALDAYFYHFELLSSAEMLEEAGKKLANVLQVLTKSHFGHYRGLRIPNSGVHLDGLLQRLKAVHYKSALNSIEKPLFLQVIPTIAQFIAGNMTAEEYGSSGSKRLPYAEFYLLFWLLEVSHEACFDITQEHSALHSTNELIVDTIASEYKKTMTHNMRIAYCGGDEDDLFEQMNWALVFDLASDDVKQKVLFAIEVDDLAQHMTEMIENPEDDTHSSRSSLINIARTHLRLLFILFQSQTVKLSTERKTLIESVILSWVARFCGDKTEYFGLFSSLYKSSYSGIKFDFTDRLTALSQGFSDDGYVQFLELLADNEIGLGNLLKLYAGTVSSQKRQAILAFIEQLTPADGRFYDVTTLKEAIIVALNLGLVDLAQSLIDYGKENARQSFANDWLALDYKVTLRRIFHDESLATEEKFDAINKIEIPFKSRGTAGTPQYDLWEQLDQDRLYLAGSLYIEEDPERSHKILSHLVEQNTNISFIANRLAANIQMIEDKYQTENLQKQQAYSRALDSWANSSGEYQFNQLTIYNQRLLLQCYLATDDLMSFQQSWESLPQHNRYQDALVPLYCKFLQKQGKSEHALKFLADVHDFHDELADDVVNEFDKIKDDLLNNVTLPLSAIKAYESLGHPFTIMDAKIAWSRITELNVEEKARLFGRSSIAEWHFEYFVLDNIKPVVHELLNRSANLRRQVENKQNATKYTVKTELEDIINDWFISLLGQKLSYLNWQVDEQKRGGFAPGSKNSGEIDAWVLDSDRNHLFLIEALRLEGWSKSAVLTHINKLAQYDLIGTSPLIFMNYVNSDDFTSLCVQYTELLAAEQYNGFDNIKVVRVAKQFKAVDAGGHYRIYREVRAINGKPIVIFHLLLDFRAAWEAAVSEQV